MGGFGSGRSAGLGRDTVESTRSIDVNRLHREGCLRPGWCGGWQSTRDGEKVASINLRAEGERLHLSYRVRIAGSDWEEMEETVRIVRVPCRFGHVMNEKDYLEQLREHARETRRFFSNPHQPKRERMVVCAFLRCIGIDFSVCEIQSKPEQNDSVDVEFRDARFQVTDLLWDRKPGRLWQERERNWENADSISDLEEPWTDSEPISYDEISREIAKHLEQKATRYTSGTCAMVDVLVHVYPLPERHLWPPDDPVSNHHNDLVQQGWRSVSMVFLPYGSVLAACGTAPEFLRSYNGKILKEWERTVGWFDLE